MRPNLALEQQKLWLQKQLQYQAEQRKKLAKYQEASND